MAKKYEIVKFYQHPDKLPHIVQRNYSLEQARSYLDDPEMSSRTATPPRGCGNDPKKIAQWNDKQKHWFMGFRLQV